MNYFYLYFIIGYYTYSTIGLIIDIFTTDKRINSINIFSIKKEYINVSTLVNTNVIIRSLPFLLLAELMYVNHIKPISYVMFFIQYVITIILGINLEYLLNKLKHSNLLYKYHSKHHSKQILFGYMTYYTHPYDFCLSMLLIIFPALLRFSPMITNTWILLYLYKIVVLDHCNISIIGDHYNLHHNIGKHNYGLKFIDNLFDTFSNDFSFLKKKNEDIKDSEIKTLPPSDNYRCYSYLCKTNNKIDKINNINYTLGKLHYSNFF